MNRRAWIFTMGTEIVQGRVLNTNASFIGRRLTLIGFQVVGVVSLIDDVDVMEKYLATVIRERPRLVVTTGGLGPTYDDRTLEAVARATGRRLVLNQEALEMIRRRCEAAGQGLTAERVKMAYLPEGATPIPNPVGSAPGSWLEVDEVVVVSLPGVPSEMEAMWSSWVEPRLRTLIPSVHVVEEVVSLRGAPEALVAPVLREIIGSIPGVYVKTHPKGSELGEQVLDVYVMYSHEDAQKALDTVKRAIKLLKDRLSERLGAKPELL